MKRRSLILALLLLNLAAIPLRAQWSGSVGFTGGVGGHTGSDVSGIGFLGHALTQGDFTLRYKSDSLSWTTVVKGEWEPRTTDDTSMNFTEDKSGRNVLETAYKTEKKQPVKASIRSELSWKPGPGRSYTAWLRYEYKQDHARHVSNQKVLDMDAPEEDEFLQAMCSYESLRKNGHEVGAGARAEWKLDAKNLLLGSFSLSTTGSRNHTTWSVFQTERNIFAEEVDVIAAFRQGEAWMYRITPHSIDLDFEADLHLQNTIRDDKKVRLRWAPGLRVSGNHSSDQNSGATLSDIDSQGEYVWKDSLRLREYFNFLDIRLEPYLSVGYRGEKVQLTANYALQFPFRRLNDDTRKQDLAFRELYPVGNARFTWNISDVHSLGLTHELEVIHPDYLQLCWYERPGPYADQLYRGNEELLSSLRSRYGLNYELKWKQFRYRTKNTLTRQINETEKTWSKEEIDGRTYKVFQWLNAADKWQVGTVHRVGWVHPWVEAGLEVEYNHTRRIAKDDGAVKNSSDWSLRADFDAKLGKGWGFRTEVEYKSKVSTFFSRFNEYWRLNARIRKQFSKVTLFLEGRDLLDTPTITTVESADGAEYMVEYVRPNRRLFLLGLQWSF